jgi:single-strand DNA-binding protein
LTEDVNQIQLTGYLGSEPLLYDVGDHPVAELALACQRRCQVSCGELQLTTTWFNLTAWEELAAYCGRFLHRGDRVSVAGTLQLWSETRGPVSILCHRILLEQIVLLAVR